MSLYAASAAQAAHPELNDERVADVRVQDGTQDAVLRVGLLARGEVPVGVLAVQALDVHRAQPPAFGVRVLLPCARLRVSWKRANSNVSCR